VRRLPVPAFRPVSIDDDPVKIALSVGYPVVLKPLAMSGSRGVIRADNTCELVSAFNRGEIHTYYDVVSRSK